VGRGPNYQGYRGLARGARRFEGRCYSPGVRRATPFLALAAVVIATAVLFLPLCGFLHRCGCQAPGAGGATHCNVRNARGPHCPWCEHPALGGGVAAGTVGGPLAAFWGVRRRRGPLEGALAALLVLPISLAASGTLAWLATDYPHFVVEEARSRLGIPNGPLRCVVAQDTTDRRDCCPRPTPIP
jgi:hypothetical protein